MGFKLSFPTVKASSEQYRLSLKVMTVNAGDIVSMDAFLKLIASEKPDVIAFQEWYPQQEVLLKKTLRAGEWDWRSKGGLGLASRFKIRSMEVKARRPSDGFGDVVAKYELATPAGPVYVLNVHLQTPRRGIYETLKGRSSAVHAMQKITAVQEQESLLASNLARPFQPVLVAGDFNLPERNPLFQAIWSRYRDAFSMKGFGFGFTRHESWLRVRIDHILFDPCWQALEARVGPDIGGDHYPLIARLALVGKGPLPSSPEEEKKAAAIPDNKNTLLFEAFEFSPGKFSNNSTADLSVGSETACGHGLSLRISTLTLFEPLQAGVTFDEWDLVTFPAVSFYYSIPPQTPVAMRVKTAWGDWLCLGGTLTSQCPSEKAQPELRLIDDGAWHEATLDVKAAVQSILPGVRSLREFQFFNAKNEHRGDQFWIDEFRIFAP
jgi:endonuclease/exonuclease/phosphatase family metal-dependent hydrolase